MTSERAILLGVTVMVAFAISALLGRWVIPVLHRLKFGQTIRDIGPAWHKNKQGTPTMGGVLFIAGCLVATMAAIAASEWLQTGSVFRENDASLTRLFAGILLALCCGGIGFLDDYIKVVKKRNLGLTSKQKLFAQLLIAVGYALSVYLADGTAIYIPFFGTVDIGIWFIPLCVFAVTAMVNATNLTDGVDGLCGTVGVVSCSAFVVAAGFTGFFGQGLFAAALAGALAGFLVWNLHPAKVFMGDTGSLFIGGVLCAVAFGIGHPFLLLPFGVIYVAETVSVVLQVGYFKLTHGKRLFKMSPIHHHFEMSGWSENKIVVIFSLITLLCSAVVLFLNFHP